MKHVWVTVGAPQDIFVFKTKKLAELWLRKKGYVKRKEHWKHKSVPRDEVNEWDIWLERMSVNE